jgi:two-component sensor histidine kinase
MRLARHHEADHRVSNSLQLVSALLSMQAREATDDRVREALATAVRRVTAIGEIHRQLYHSDTGDAVDIAAYLQSLGQQLEEGLGSAPKRQRVGVYAQSAQVHPAFATMLGILMSELVMNASKHAYEPHKPGAVDVCLVFAEPSQFILEVRDYGKGAQNNESPPPAGLGMHIIETLSRRLDATCVYERGPEGTRVTLRGVVEPILGMSEAR